MAACQGMHVLRPPSLSILASLSFPAPPAWNREEMRTRRALERGDASLWEPLTPLWEQSTFLPALPPPLQQRPALSMSRSERRRRGERDGGAHRTKPKHIANHLSSSSSTCFTYRNYNKTELEKATALRNVTENNPGTHITMSNESIQRTCPHCHMCTCQEQLTTQFTQTCLRWVPKNMLLLNQLSVIPHKANPPPNSIFTCCRAKCNSAIVIIYLILRLDVKPN